MATDPKLVYSTPRWVTQALIDNESFEGACWEPACGYGAIAKVFLENNITIFSTDIVDRGYEDQLMCSHTPVDFLSNHVFRFDNIITNPPFSLGREFVEKALECANKKVAMLFRLAFLESESRKEFFENTPLKKILISSKRITMYPSNYEGQMKNGGTMAMAWFIWDKEYIGKPYMGWF